MKIPFGKHKGQDMSTLPIDYLNWLVANIEPGDIREEARRILASGDVKLEQQSKSLEQQANEILGEEPVKLLRRGFRRRGR